MSDYANGYPLWLLFTLYGYPYLAEFPTIAHQHCIHKEWADSYTIYSRHCTSRKIRIGRRFKTNQGQCFSEHSGRNVIRFISNHHKFAKRSKLRKRMKKVLIRSHQWLFYFSAQMKLLLVEVALFRAPPSSALPTLPFYLPIPQTQPSITD